MKLDGINLEWLGHASFRISNDKVIYIDPFKLLSSKPKADLIVVTHEHYAHCSLDDISKIKKIDTVVVCPENCIEKLAPLGLTTMKLKIGETISAKGINITAVHAYNIGKQFHPKGFGMGVILEIGKLKIYHAGDTDLIPEMKKLSNEKIDVALLPVGGTYTMSASEAAKAAEIIKPDIAVPMHYGSIVGSVDDAEHFKENYKGKTIILERSK